MCGICGIAGHNVREEPVGMATIEAMTRVIEHRGPDDDGHMVAPGVALGMRRLSIIDIGGSTQPLSNEDGTVWTVFNGEIYNFAELRERLTAQGHRFQTDGDTET